MQNITRRISLSVVKGVVTIPLNSPWVKFWIVTIDTEASGATDELQAIRGGNIGDFCVLMSKDRTRAITIKSNLKDPTNSRLLMNGDFILNKTSNTCMLIKSSESPDEWLEIGHSANA